MRVQIKVQIKVVHDLNLKLSHFSSYFWDKNRLLFSDYSGIYQGKQCYCYTVKWRATNIYILLGTYITVIFWGLLPKVFLWLGASVLHTFCFERRQMVHVLYHITLFILLYFILMYFIVLYCIVNAFYISMHFIFMCLYRVDVSIYFTVDCGKL